MNTETNEKLTLDLKEVCERMNISLPTLRKALKAGKIPSLKLSARRIVIPVAGLNRYLEGIGLK
jgi:excisionase family DNA binding protein